MLTIALPAAATFSGSGKSARARPGRPARSRGAGSSSSSALPPPPSLLPLLLTGSSILAVPASPPFVMDVPTEPIPIGDTEAEITHISADHHDLHGND